MPESYHTAKLPTQTSIEHKEKCLLGGCSSRCTNVCRAYRACSSSVSLWSRYLSRRTRRFFTFSSSTRHCVPSPEHKQYWSLTASHIISVPVTHCFTCHLSTVTHCFTYHLSTRHSLLHISSQWMQQENSLENEVNSTAQRHFSENLKIILKMANCVTGTHSNLIVYTR